MSTIRLQYLFDPLCGWCYASAPALAGLSATFPSLLELHLSGLFSGAGSRALTSEFGDYAWSNDQRIAAMTGQVFSEAYRKNVLQASGVRFDSEILSRALTAIAAIDSRLEAGLLHRLQSARYVGGKDTADAGVVARTMAACLQEHGHQADATELALQLATDTGLAQRTAARIHTAQALMAQLGVRGVPQLIVRVNDAVVPISSSALHHGPDLLIAELRRLFGKGLAEVA